jgi:hypothetical protein
VSIVVASWPVAGDGLRRGSGESAEFPTGVKEVVTLLVNSKKRGTAVSYTTFEGQRDRVHSSGETYSHGVGDRPPQLNQQSHNILYSCAH